MSVRGGCASPQDGPARRWGLLAITDHPTDAWEDRGQAVRSPPQPAPSRWPGAERPAPAGMTLQVRGGSTPPASLFSDQVFIAPAFLVSPRPRMARPRLIGTLRGCVKLPGAWCVCLLGRGGTPGPGSPLRLSFCAGRFLAVEKGCECAVRSFHTAMLPSLETFPANSPRFALSPGGTLGFWVTDCAFSPEAFHVLSSRFKHCSSRADCHLAPV